MTTHTRRETAPRQRRSPSPPVLASRSCPPTSDAEWAAFRSATGPERTRLRNIIIESNWGLICFTARSVLPRVIRNIDPDDALSLAAETIMRAVETFDPARGVKFSAYFTRSCAINALRIRFAAEKRGHMMARWRALQRARWLAPVSFDAAEEIIAAMGLPERDEAALRMRMSGATFRECGCALGISKERVRQITRHCAERYLEVTA